MSLKISKRLKKILFPSLVIFMLLVSSYLIISFLFPNFLNSVSYIIRASISQESGGAQAISITNPHQGFSYNYKGNTHAHSTNSDGTQSPTVVGQWYRDNGYDFYTITDHNILTPDPGVSSILWFGKSEEASLSGNTAHMGCLNINTAVPNVDAQTMISNALSQGGQTVLNHIDRVDKRWTAETIENLTDVMAVEIYNGGGLNSTGTWDTVLTSGKTIWGTAADDSHSLAAMGNGYVVVNSNNASPTKTEILNQMFLGNFYASRGFDLSITVSGGEISASTTNGNKIKWIKESGTVIKTTSGLSDTYTPVGDEEYVRVEILNNSDEPQAWSQPLVVVNAVLSLSNISSTNIKPNSATVTWNSNRGATSMVEYGISSGVLDSSTSTEATLKINHSMDISSLISAAKYYFRAVSIDSDTNTVNSGVSYFTTSGYPNGSLVTSPSTGKVYFLAEGEKQWISSPTVFNSHGFSWSDIISVSDSELNTYAEGSQVKAREGTLITASSTHKVYVADLTGSTYQKRWVTSPGVFNSLGYNWNEINWVSPAELNDYEEIVGVSN